MKLTSVPLSDTQFSRLDLTNSTVSHSISNMAAESLQGYCIWGYYYMLLPSTIKATLALQRQNLTWTELDFAVHVTIKQMQCLMQ